MASSQPPQQKEEEKEEECEVQSQPNPTAAQKRHDIQGLRTVAILAVFFFHMWPQQFPNGYLGVDVFFVISGYLIGMILLSRGDRSNVPQRVNEGGHVYIQLPTQLDGEGNRLFDSNNARIELAQSSLSVILPIIATLQFTVHFYRRRVQRIMPAYAVTILATLLVGRVILIPDFELARLKWDAAWALALAYNMEGLTGHNRVTQNDDYFEEMKSPRFLTHTWSLGVELQFYAVAPLLLAVCRWECFRPLKYPYLFVIAAASCYAQWLSPAEVAFGAMPCRLWQFFAGVLSYALGNTLASEAPPAKELPQHSDDSEQIEPSRWRQAGGAVADYAMLGGLVALLGSPLHHPRLAFAGQAAVVLLTALLLHRHAHIRALTNRASVELGDLSYLVYLVHWPLLQFLRYRYGAWNVAGVLVGICILLICVGAAYLLDRVLDSPLRRVANFGWLSLYLLAIYAGCLAVILPLPYQVSDERLTTVPLNGQLVRMNDYGSLFLALMDNGTLDVGKLSSGEKAMINMQMGKTRANGVGIERYNINFNVNVSELRQIRESNGSVWSTKNSFEGEGRISIFLVGNSHAAHIAYEVISTWRPLYSVLYIFIVYGCSPFDINRHHKCEDYPQAAVTLIRRLQPDIIFINVLWAPHGLQSNLSDDFTVQQVHAALEEMMHYSRMLVFGLPNLMFPKIRGDNQLQSNEIARRVWFGLPLDDLDYSLKSHLKYTTLNRQRIEYATREIPDCNHYHSEETSGGGVGIYGLQRPTRCLFVDWAEAFCDEQTQVCRPYGVDTQLAYFFDMHHYTWLGSHRVRPLLDRLGSELVTIFN